MKTLAARSVKTEVWAVGEHVQVRLADTGLPVIGLFSVPNSVRAITPLVGRILVESETRGSEGEAAELHLFHNRPTAGAVMSPSLSDCFLSTRSGEAGSPTIPGRRETCRK